MHDRAEGPRLIEKGTPGEKIIEEFDEEARFEAEKDSVVASARSGELKGAALDEALEKANVPKTGSADEKREALIAKLAPSPE